MAQAPALDEQETTFIIEATNRKLIYVFSNDSVWLAKLERCGIEPVSEDEYGKSYEIDLDDFTFILRPKRKMSDEEKAKLAKRLAAARKARPSLE